MHADHYDILEAKLDKLLLLAKSTE
jgi:hypothetical protein